MERRLSPCIDVYLQNVVNVTWRSIGNEAKPIPIAFVVTGAPAFVCVRTARCRSDCRSAVREASSPWRSMGTTSLLRDAGWHGGEGDRGFPLPYAEACGGIAMMRIGPEAWAQALLCMSPICILMLNCRLFFWQGYSASRHLLYV